MHTGDCLCSFPSLLKRQSPGAVVQEPVPSRQAVLRARAEPGPGVMAPGHPTLSHHTGSSASPPSLRWPQHETSANPGLREPGNQTTVPTSLLSGECLASATRCRARDGASPSHQPAGTVQGSAKRFCPGPRTACLCLRSRAACPPASVTGPQRPRSLLHRPQCQGKQEPGTLVLTHIDVRSRAPHHGARGLMPQPHQSSDPAWKPGLSSLGVQWLDVGPLQSPHLRVRSPPLSCFVAAAPPARPRSPSAARCTGG